MLFEPVLLFMSAFTPTAMHPIQEAAALVAPQL
jgi:hypothetical protein